MKSLDAKIADIRRNPTGSRAFIIADAKDADMAFGITAPGQRRPLNPERVPKAELRWRSLEEYREQIRAVVRQGLVDIMLMSASNVEQLAMKERIFEGSAVTPAARANDATDIWVVRGGGYVREASRPFRSATIDHIQCGELGCDTAAPVTGADLGLYSVTFTNDMERDYETLRALKEFREEAERKGFRYFLEVFDPNVDTGLPPERLDGFINDHIIRSLAGVTEKGRPLFLKVAWRGPKAMEELCAYDPRLIVGVMGGGAGTTLDAFRLIADAQKHGARAALFGRKINHAEEPLAFIEMLRRIVEGAISPEEAVKAYHSVLEKLDIRPHRTLAEDLQLSATATSYGGGARKTITKPDGFPVVEKAVTSAGNGHVAEQLARLRKRFGE